MVEFGSLATEWLTGGVVVAVLGIFVKFVGWTWLLAGYSESTSPVPDDVVQDIAGNTLLRIGIGLSACGVFAFVAEVPPYFDTVIGVAILVAVLRLLYRLNTWTPQRT
jgi:hypothetical protein